MSVQRFAMDDEKLKALSALMEPEREALFNAAVKLREKLASTGVEWDTTNGINYALVAVCQAFGLPASMHGWLEARRDERLFTVHSCGAILPSYASQAWLAQLWPRLEHMAKLIALEPYAVIEAASNWAKKEGLDEKSDSSNVH